MMKNLTVTASLVLYKPDLCVLERVLLTMQKAAAVARRSFPTIFEVTLVDNSDDLSIHSGIESWLNGLRPCLSDWNVHLIRSTGNVGYGSGNNLVIEQANSDYHLVINPDVFVDANALEQCLCFMEADPSVGLLSPAVFGEDGERHFLCKRYPTLFVMFLRSIAPGVLNRLFDPVIRQFEMRDCDYNKTIHPLEYPSGCFMFFRTKVLKKIGGFDPGFFLHYEDADIGRRLLAVARSVYVPHVRVVHRWSRDTHRSLRSKLITVRSGFRYWRKWGGFLSAPQAGERMVCAMAPSNDGPAGARGGTAVVTGANGFVGRALCPVLADRGWHVRAVLRSPPADLGMSSVEPVVIPEFEGFSDWSSVFTGADVVLHLAARVHQMRESEKDPLFEYRRVNVAMTCKLAQAAAVAGVRRFVFVSSIKVNGEQSPVGQPFTPDDPAHPADPYAISKYEAEQALLKIGSETGLQVVIVRPVLVYGPSVKANFESMMAWLRRPVPLPFGALFNRRSLVALDNLVDFLVLVASHPRATNRIFLISDGKDLSLCELMTILRDKLGGRALILPVSMELLRHAGLLLGQKAYVERLCSSLQVDISSVCRELAWHPVVSPEDALSQLANSVAKVGCVDG